MDSLFLTPLTVLFKLQFSGFAFNLQVNLVAQSHIIYPFALGAEHTNYFPCSLFSHMEGILS